MKEMGTWGLGWEHLGEDLGDEMANIGDIGSYTCKQVCKHCKHLQRGL